MIQTISVTAGGAFIKEAYNHLGKKIRTDEESWRPRKTIPRPKMPLSALIKSKTITEVKAYATWVMKSSQSSVCPDLCLTSLLTAPPCGLGGGTPALASRARDAAQRADTQTVVCSYLLLLYKFLKNIVCS